MTQIIKFPKIAIKLATSTNNYKENVITVCNYVSAVASSELPTLFHTFPEWDTFTQTYINAKTDALGWTNNVLASLLQTPRDILDYNKAMQIGFSDAISNSDFLIQHPNDKMTREMLTVNLKHLLQLTSSSKSEVALLLTKIQSFASDLPLQAEKLQAIADNAAKEEQVDEDKVNELNADIGRLNDEINSLTTQIVGLGIVDAACITLGITAVAVAGPWGLITWPFLGVAGAVATTFIVLDGIQISNDLDKIKSDQKNINEYTQDAAQLKAFANTFSNLANTAIAIQTNVQQIIEVWTNLENSIQTVIDDLLKSESEMTSENWKSVKSTFELALEDWNLMIKLVGSLNIQINANDAKIEPGMSEEEVKEAMNKGNTMGYLEYINKIA